MAIDSGIGVKASTSTAPQTAANKPRETGAKAPAPKKDSVVATGLRKLGLPGAAREVQKGMDEAAKAMKRHNTYEEAVPAAIAKVAEGGGRAAVVGVVELADQADRLVGPALGGPGVKADVERLKAGVERVKADTARATRPLRKEAAEAKREVKEAQAQADRSIKASRADGDRKIDAKLEGTGSHASRIGGAAVEFLRQGAKQELIEAREGLKIGKEVLEGAGELALRNPLLVHAGEEARDLARGIQSARKTAEAATRTGIVVTASAADSAADATRRGAENVGNGIVSWGRQRFADGAMGAAAAGAAISQTRTDVTEATRNQHAESRREIAEAKVQARRDLATTRREGEREVEATLEGDASPGTRIRVALQQQVTQKVTEDLVAARGLLNVGKEMGEGAIEDVATDVRNTGAIISGGARATGKFFGGLFGG